MVKFLGLVVLVTLVFTLACQEPTPAPAPTLVSIQVTATPDLPATVAALAEKPTSTPLPTSTVVKKDDFSNRSTANLS